MPQTKSVKKEKGGGQTREMRDRERENQKATEEESESDVCICMYVCIYIYIYIFAVKLLSGPSLGFPKLLSGPSQCYYLGQVCFRTIKIGVSGDLFFAQLSFCVSFLCPVIC